MTRASDLPPSVSPLGKDQEEFVKALKGALKEADENTYKKFLWSYHAKLESILQKQKGAEKRGFPAAAINRAKRALEAAISKPDAAERDTSLEFVDATFKDLGAIKDIALGAALIQAVLEEIVSKAIPIPGIMGLLKLVGKAGQKVEKLKKAQELFKKMEEYAEKAEKIEDANEKVKKLQELQREMENLEKEYQP